MLVFFGVVFVDFTGNVRLGEGRGEEGVSWERAAEETACVVADEGGNEGCFVKELRYIRVNLPAVSMVCMILSTPYSNAFPFVFLYQLINFNDYFWPRAFAINADVLIFSVFKQVFKLRETDSFFVCL